MIDIKIVSQNNNSTVVEEYKETTKKSITYQSEIELENEFIKLLQTQAYEYVRIRNNTDLVKNLRTQIEKLNNFKFNDEEWTSFFKTNIANENESIKEKTRKLQDGDGQLLLIRKDGSFKNIKIIDKSNIHNNSLQVINQYEISGIHKNKYDVTVLVNGIPMIHIELKRRGIALKEAFNQINRYQRDSFWSDSGLFEFIQIFVISNGTLTKYYSNTTRFQHIKNTIKQVKTSNSFEFTSWWADAKNKRIDDLIDFTKTFFSKRTILNILTKYCVFTSDDLLLVMRPYQIVATERILNKIEMSNNYKYYGTTKAGGYIWHTTGSGKTLTSFKAARLISKTEYIDKVLFIVDRQDLDYQTMNEYDKFEKGAANATKDTKELEKKLSSAKTEDKIAITTIQKLNCFIDKFKNHIAFNKKIVLVFDECHRSQFGEFHRNIVKYFKNYYIFGFTGTPIFTINSNTSNSVNLKTTQQAFGDRLHSYTIIDAIKDGNVLPFRVEYINTMKVNQSIEDMKIWDIEREEALLAGKRIEEVTNYILKHFDQKTKRNEFYKLKEKRVSGFNALFCVSSIRAAKKYYLEFLKKQKDKNNTEKLKVATIFSFCANESEDISTVDEDMDTIKLDKTSRDFLDSAMKDYNKMFTTNFSTDGEGFRNYYKDISKRMKKRELDLLIVVNMFLTGFDATTLNTLWVDKNLKLHGLLQAYSRTNRILNSVKTFGNIVCFRDLEKNSNDSIALFGDKDASGIVILKSYSDYYNGYDNNGKHVLGYKELIDKLKKQKVSSLSSFSDEKEEQEFIRLYSGILKIKNILTSFDDYIGNEILTERQFQDYQSIYLELYDKYRKIEKADAENISSDIVFEIELIKQVEINIYYILHLVEKYHANNCKDKEVLTRINLAISSSPSLRSKKELIEEFVKRMNVESDIRWEGYIKSKKIEELKQIIKDEKLKEKETIEYINECFRDGEVIENGPKIREIMPPASPFTKNTIIKKMNVLQKINYFFTKFFDISPSKID